MDSTPAGFGTARKFASLDRSRGDGLRGNRTVRGTRFGDAGHVRVPRFGRFYRDRHLPPPGRIATGNRTRSRAGGFDRRTRYRLGARRLLCPPEHGPAHGTPAASDLAGDNGLELWTLVATRSDHPVAAVGGCGQFHPRIRQRVGVVGCLDYGRRVVWG